MKPMLLFVLCFFTVTCAQAETVTFTDAGAYRADVLTLGPENTPIYDYVVDDFDRDGDDEIGVIRWHPDVQLGLAVYEQDEQTYTFGGLIGLESPAYKEHLGDRTRFDSIDNHPLYKYVLLYAIKNHTIVYLLNGRFEIVKVLKTIRGQDRTNTGRWNGEGVFNGLWDVNQDGRDEIMLRFNTGSDAKPRCFLALDIQSGKVVFRRDFAPMPGDAQIVNFNNGSDFKMVTKFTGAGHGEFFGPFKRNESYLAVFNMDGALLKSWEHPGVNTQVRYCLNDVNQDSYLDIIAVFSAKAQTGPGTPNTIRVIDGAALEQIHVHDAGVEQRYKLICPLACTKTPYSRFVTSDRSMNLEILTYHSDGHHFQVERRLTGNKVAANHIYTFDVNRDGCDEIFVHANAENTMYVLNHQFDVLAGFSYSGSADRFKIRQATGFDGASVYFLNDQELNRADFPTTELFPPPALNLQPLGIGLQLQPLHFVAVSVLLLGLFGIANVFIGRRRETASLIDSFYIAAVLMKPSGKIIWSNGAMLRLIGDGRRIRGVDLPTLLKNRKFEPILPHFNIFKKGKQAHLRQALQIRDERGKQDILIEFSRIRSHMQLVILENEPQNREQLEIWAGMAQRLVHKAKTPLSSMLLSVQRLQREMKKEGEIVDHYEPYLQNIGSEIERVRKQVNEFLRFSRLHPAELKQYPVNRLLTEFCEYAKRRHFGRARIRCDPPESDYDILVDADQIKEAMENFVDNAVEAGKTHDTNILISCSLQKQAFSYLDRISIEISDDGIGIPKSKLDSIFEPGFTSKENGSGMGLLIAKTLIEQNDGELLMTSREKIGTTITILLPLLEHQKDGDENP